MCGDTSSGRGSNRATPFVVAPRVVSAFLLYVHYMRINIQNDINFCGDSGEYRPCRTPSVNKSFSLDLAHGRCRDLCENGEYYNFVELDTDSLEVSYRTFDTNRVRVISGFLVRLGVSSGLLGNHQAKARKEESQLTYVLIEQSVKRCTRSNALVLLW